MAVLTKWNSSCMALYVCKEKNFALKKAGILPQTHMLFTIMLSRSSSAYELHAGWKN